LIFSASFLPTLWRALDKIFRFLQPKAREESDFPDDFDLHLAGGLENDRELALFRRLSDLRRGFSDSIIVPLDWPATQVGAASRG